MQRVSSKAFFEAWLKSVRSKNSELINVWNIAKSYTQAVLGYKDSVIADVAESLSLKHYSEYYSMDAIIFDPKADKILDCAPLSETWLCRARVAIEHENVFFSGLYKEVGHLLLLDCDLRVLITYPPPHNDRVEPELSKLSGIIEQSGKAKVISKESSFLLILGFKSQGDVHVRWSARVFKDGDWIELD
jgi:hypothetical protein